MVICFTEAQNSIVLRSFLHVLSAATNKNKRKRLSSIKWNKMEYIDITGNTQFFFYYSQRKEVFLTLLHSPFSLLGVINFFFSWSRRLIHLKRQTVSSHSIHTWNINILHFSWIFFSLYFYWLSNFEFMRIKFIFIAYLLPSMWFCAIYFMRLLCARVSSTFVFLSFLYLFIAYVSCSQWAVSMLLYDACSRHFDKIPSIYPPFASIKWW